MMCSYNGLVLTLLWGQWRHEWTLPQQWTHVCQHQHCHNIATTFPWRCQLSTLWWQMTGLHFTDLSLDGRHPLPVLSGAGEEHAVGPVPELEHCVPLLASSHLLYSQATTLNTCITRSKMKLRGRPKTVRMSPLWSSIQRMNFFFIQLVSSMVRSVSLHRM